MDATHNPEFTTIEKYQAYTDYHGMMELSEDQISRCCMLVNGTTKIKYGEYDIDLTPPFARLSMNDAVKKYANADFLGCATDEEARELAKKI